MVPNVFLFIFLLSKRRFLLFWILDLTRLLAEVTWIVRSLSVIFTFNYCQYLSFCKSFCLSLNHLFSPCIYLIIVARLSFTSAFTVSSLELRLSIFIFKNSFSLNSWFYTGVTGCDLNSYIFIGHLYLPPMSTSLFLLFSSRHYHSLSVYFFFLVIF